jgi:hypothetical protein
MVLPGEAQGVHQAKRLKTKYFQPTSRTKTIFTAAPKGGPVTHRSMLGQAPSAARKAEYFAQNHKKFRNYALSKPVKILVSLLLP